MPTNGSEEINKLLFNEILRQPIEISITTFV